MARSAIIFASSNGEDQKFTVTDGKQYVDVVVPSNSVVSVLFGNIEEKTADIEENGTYDLIEISLILSRRRNP